MSVPDDGRPGLLWGTNEIVLENIWDVIRKPFTSVRGGSARRLTLIYYIADGPWDVYKVTAMPPRLTLLRVKKCFSLPLPLSHGRMAVLSRRGPWLVERPARYACLTRALLQPPQQRQAKRCVFPFMEHGFRKRH